MKLMISLREIPDKVRREWPLGLSGTSLAIISVMLLFNNLGGLLPGASPAEIEVARITSDFPSLTANLLYWPYYFLVYMARPFFDDPILAARFVSASLGLVAVVSLLLIVQRWFTTRIGLLGVALFITNSWFLVIARQGTPQILSLTSLLLLLATSLWLVNRPKKLLPGLAFLLMCFSAWFVPYMPLLLAAAVFALFTRERRILKIIPKMVWISVIGLTIAAVASMIWGLIIDSQQARLIFGLPEDISSLADFPVNAWLSVKAFVWQAPIQPQNWIGNLSLFDAFGLIMIVIGFYHHEGIFSGRRSLVLFGTLAMVFAMVSLNGGPDSLGFSMLLPLLVLMMISGVQDFLGKWQGVFPRNPLARFLSSLLVASVIGLSIFYNLSRAFTAWPKSPQVKALYSQSVDAN